MASYRYQCLECGKTYLGPALATGTMSCNCVPPKMIRGTLIYTPLSDALQEILPIDKANKLRNELCQRWGIPNKSHATHGANFSSNQTLVNLINNIVIPVQGQLRTTVRQLVIQDYGYDIDTKEMAY